MSSSVVRSDASAAGSLGTQHTLGTQGTLGITQLHLAILQNRFREVKALLERGHNPNTGDGNGNTPLHMAAFAGRIDIMELLVEHGADPSCVDCMGNSLWHAVASCGAVEAGRYIADLHVDVLRVNAENKTALDICRDMCPRRRKEGMIELLDAVIYSQEMATPLPPLAMEELNEEVEALRQKRAEGGDPTDAMLSAMQTMVRAFVKQEEARARHDELLTKVHDGLGNVEKRLEQLETLTQNESIESLKADRKVANTFDRVESTLGSIVSRLNSVDEALQSLSLLGHAAPAMSPNTFNNSQSQHGRSSSQSGSPQRRGSYEDSPADSPPTAAGNAGPMPNVNVRLAKVEEMADTESLSGRSHPRGRDVEQSTVLVLKDTELRLPREAFGAYEADGRGQYYNPTEDGDIAQALPVKLPSTQSLESQGSPVTEQAYMRGPSQSQQQQPYNKQINQGWTAGRDWRGRAS